MINLKSANDYDNVKDKQPYDILSFSSVKACKIYLATI